MRGRRTESDGGLRHLAFRSFQAKVHGIRKAPEQRATDSRPEILILVGAVGNAVIGCAQLGEELESKSGLLVLLPLVRRRHVEISPRLRNQPVLGH